MGDTLNGKRIAFLAATEGTEQVELAEGEHAGQRQSVESGAA